MNAKYVKSTTLVDNTPQFRESHRDFKKIRAEHFGHSKKVLLNEQTELRASKNHTLFPPMLTANPNEITQNALQQKLIWP